MNKFENDMNIDPDLLNPDLLWKRDNPRYVTYPWQLVNLGGKTPKHRVNEQVFFIVCLYL